jgi:hypothetical protein
MNHNNVSRRDFMKVMGVAGAGSALGAGRAAAQDKAPAPPAAVGKVPTRPFGKTGVKVPILALGGIFDISTNQLTLQRALDLGVNYWDTAHVYVNGNSELGIGMYFEKHPEARKNVFLVTKAGGSPTPDGLTKMLELSFQRLKTDYVDLFFLHGIRDGGALTDEVKNWAEKAKAANKIRFFGFSTHDNMADCLQAGAKAGWIDAVMPKCDFRQMNTDEMRAALDACAKAGVGITAMKTQGRGSFNLESEADLKLGGHFMKSGFTQQQAKIKAIWENQQISSVCSAMYNVTVLSANAAAAMDKTKLSAADHDALRQYAAETRGRHCAGCTRLCESALGNQVPIGNLMRSLMYHHGYGDTRLAKEVYEQVPEGVRARLVSTDYAAAERVCPHALPIAQMVREAVELLG